MSRVVQLPHSRGNLVLPHTHTTHTNLVLPHTHTNLVLPGCLNGSGRKSQANNYSRNIRITITSSHQTMLTRLPCCQICRLARFSRVVLAKGGVYSLVHKRGPSVLGSALGHPTTSWKITKWRWPISHAP